jgi:uncharacterized protein (TIGR02001 family)
MRNHLMVAAVVAALLVPAVAQAANGLGLRGSITATSDYRFRGVSQNDRNVAPQGSLNLDGPDGWYAGTWASKIDFNDGRNTSIEWDIWFGKHFDLGGDTDLNIQPYYYAYPNHDSDEAGFHYSYFELITTLTKKFGDVTLAGTVAWSPNWFSESGTAWWLNANIAYALNEWLSLSGNLGRQSAHDFNSTTGAGYPYYVWDAGVTATWKQFALDLRYADTDLAKTECAVLNGEGNGSWCGATIIGTLTYNFTLL